MECRLGFVADLASDLRNRRMALAEPLCGNLHPPHGQVAHRHRNPHFKKSNDPASEKLEDIVRLYIDAPRHPIGLSMDEKNRSRRCSFDADRLDVSELAPRAAV
jgi:hypothetical protein